MQTLKLDGNKLLHHLDALEKWQTGKLIFPIYISLSLIQTCNHRCVFCAYGYRERSSVRFPRQQLRSLLAEWRETDVKALFFSGDGEPLLHPECTNMAADVVAHGIDVALNTNGSLLCREVATELVRSMSWIRISINGGKDTYAKVHGVNASQFDLVMANLAAAVDERGRAESSATIGVQCLLLKENRDEIVNLARLVKAAGADYFSLKPYLPSVPSSFNGGLYEADDLLEELGALTDARFNCHVRETLHLPERSYKRCLGQQFITELDAAGNVSCCGPRLGDDRFAFGNAFQKSFTEVWRSDRRRKAVESIESSFDLSDCMPGCRCDSINRLLWAIRNPPAHVNYI